VNRISKRKGQDIVIERTNGEETKKQIIKDLIQKLHAGVSPDEVKGRRNEF
jgi:hypothetical protein